MFLLIINKPRPNLYSGDTCLSPDGVPWVEVSQHCCPFIWNSFLIFLTYNTVLWPIGGKDFYAHSNLAMPVVEMEYICYLKNCFVDTSHPSKGEIDRRSTRSSSNTVFCVSCPKRCDQITSFRRSKRASDQIAFYAFHSFSFVVQTNDGYIRRIGRLRFVVPPVARKKNVQ